MNFKEEYKSAINRISPGENASQRIEQAVLNEISGQPVKIVPQKKKKPFYVYAAAFSGAAACVAITVTVLVNVLPNALAEKNNMAGEQLTVLETTDSIAFSKPPTAVNSAGAQDINNGVFDECSSYANDSVYSEQSGTAEAPGALKEPDAFEQAGATENNNDDLSVDAEKAEPALEGFGDNHAEEYELIFAEEGEVILKSQSETKRYEPDGTVAHYYEEADIHAVTARCEDGTVVSIKIEDKYLYIFEDDLQSASVYKLIK